MKILLTIEEYRERAVELVASTASTLIKEEAPDIFKFETISMLAHKAMVNDIRSYDSINQLYLKTFCLEREGNPLTEETIKKIDKAEADEFNEQPWYKEFNEKARKNYEPLTKLHPYKDMGGRDDQWRLFDVERLVQKPFEDINSAYHISLEVFKRLYGHDYEVDKEYKFR